jgi:N-acetylmuramic acid 6-phosphate etherase
MVDLRASNVKRRDRSARIVSMIAGVPREEAFGWVDRAGGHVKVAVVMIRKGVEVEEAKRLLDQAGGSLREALAGNRTNDLEQSA